MCLFCTHGHIMNFSFTEWFQYLKPKEKRAIEHYSGIDREQLRHAAYRRRNLSIKRCVALIKASTEVTPEYQLDLPGLRPDIWDE